MINNRQNGRRRGRGGQRPQGGSSQGQRDNGNRIDSRARGNASQLYEKYKNMASDAQRQGDRVNTEYYLQFADHYFRVLADQRGRYEDQQPRRQQNDFDGDDDYGDEGEPIRADEQGRGGDERGERDGNRGEGRGDARGDNRQSEPRQSESRQFDGGRSYDGSRQREGGRQFDRQRPTDGNRQRDDNRQVDTGRDRQARDMGRYGDAGEAEPRATASARRFAAPRDDEGRRDERVAGDEGGVDVAQPSRDAEMSMHGGAVPVAEETAAPKRRGRPRKTVAPDEQLGLDSSVLPPSIGMTEPAAAGDAAEAIAPKPRRRRTAASASEATPETTTVN